MGRKAEFVLIQGEGRLNEAFRFAYGKSILIALNESGFLTSEQVNGCIAKLEQQIDKKEGSL